MSAFAGGASLEMLSRHRVVACAALGVVAIGYAVFVFRPIQARISARSAEVERIDQEAREGSREAEGLPRLTDEVATAEAFLAICETRAAVERRRGELLAGLSRAAEESGLELLAMQPEAGPTFETFGTEVVRLDASGSYGSFVAFAAKVERMPFAMQLGECRLSATSHAESRQRSSEGAEFSDDAVAIDSGLSGSFAFVVFAGTSDNSDGAGALPADR